MASKVFKLVGSMVLRMFSVPPEPPVAVSPSSAALESPESLAVLLVPALELVPEGVTAGGEGGAQQGKRHNHGQDFSELHSKFPL